MKNCIANHLSLVSGTTIEITRLVESLIDPPIDETVLLHETATIEVPEMAAVLHVTTIMLQEVVVMEDVQDHDHLDVDPGVQP